MKKLVVLAALMALASAPAFASKISEYPQPATGSTSLQAGDVVPATRSGVTYGLTFPVISGGGGSGITALTGDVSASGTGSVVSTLSTVNSNVGSFGSGSLIPSFTVNAKGLITAAGSTPVSIGTANIQASGTANSTTYLRGDNTWATVEGGGTPGGTTGQIQYNNGGAFGGYPLGSSLAINSNTLGVANPINAQGTNTTYTVLSSDMGKTVTHNATSAVAVTLAQANTTGFTSGLAYSELNLGTAAVTITPTTSTINEASSLVLYQGMGAYIISDGTNYNAFVYLNPNYKAVFSSGTVGAQSTVSLSTSTFTADFDSASAFKYALVHASCPCTIANPSALTAGERGIIEIDQSSSGSDTVSWGSSFKFAGGTAPTLTTSANALDYFSYYVADTTHIIVSGGVLNAK